MRKLVFLFLFLFILTSHDMYLKLDTYFLSPDKMSQLFLFNGTFLKSDNVIERDRMVDASLVGNNKRIQVSDKQWSEKDSTTILSFNSGEVGTYVIGVSTKPRSLKMTAEKFNSYLEHDGVKDMLQKREENDKLEEDANEEYSKHVKAIFQVGEELTNDWSVNLGYPIEFIPLENPYAKHTGDTIQIQLLRDNKPLKNQLVYADFQNSTKSHTHNEVKEKKKEEEVTHTHNGTTHTHNGTTHTHKKKDKKDQKHKDDSTANLHDGSSHSHNNELEETHSENHKHTNGQELRTNEKGIINLNLNHDGIWYLRTIHLVETDKGDLTHESNWATLTFEVSHSHKTNSESHMHEHEHEVEISPVYFLIVSAVIVLGLFLFFNRKGSNENR